MTPRQPLGFDVPAALHIGECHVRQVHLPIAPWIIRLFGAKHGLAEDRELHAKFTPAIGFQRGGEIPPLAAIVRVHAVIVWETKRPRLIGLRKLGILV
jgi:hypothetical protein